MEPPSTPAAKEGWLSGTLKRVRSYPSQLYKFWTGSEDIPADDTEPAIASVPLTPTNDSPRSTFTFYEQGQSMTASSPSRRGGRRRIVLSPEEELAKKQRNRAQTANARAALKAKHERQRLEKEVVTNSSPSTSLLLNPGSQFTNKSASPSSVAKRSRSLSPTKRTSPGGTVTRLTLFTSTQGSLERVVQPEASLSNAETHQLSSPSIKDRRKGTSAKKASLETGSSPRTSEDFKSGPMTLKDRREAKARAALAASGHRESVSSNSSVGEVFSSSVYVEPSSTGSATLAKTLKSSSTKTKKTGRANGESPLHSQSSVNITTAHIESLQPAQDSKVADDHKALNRFSGLPTKGQLAKTFTADLNSATPEQSATPIAIEDVVSASEEAQSVPPRTTATSYLKPSTEIANQPPNGKGARVPNISPTSRREGQMEETMIHPPTLPVPHYPSASPAPATDPTPSQPPFRRGILDGLSIIFPKMRRIPPPHNPQSPKMGRHGGSYMGFTTVPSVRESKDARIDVANIIPEGSRRKRKAAQVDYGENDEETDGNDLSQLSEDRESLNKGTPAIKRKTTIHPSHSLSTTQPLEPNMDVPMNDPSTMETPVANSPLAKSSAEPESVRKRGRVPGEIWRHFDGGHAEKIAICKFCRQPMSGTGTDILRRHIINKCPNATNAVKVEVQKQIDGIIELRNAKRRRLMENSNDKS